MATLRVSRFRSRPTANIVDFETILNHYIACGLLHPAKLEQLGPVLDEIRQGWPLLLNAPPELFKLHYTTKNEAITGSVSDFRDTDETYILQHASGEKVPPGTMDCIRSQVISIGEDRDAMFLSLYFQPENRWPAQLCRHFAQASPHHLSSITLWSYLLCRTLDTRRVLPCFGVEELADRNTDEIINLVNSSMDPVRVGSLGIGRYSLDLREMNGMYAKQGLSRSRRVFGARQGGTLVGMAMCYASKTPMNFNLLCNRVEIVVARDSPNRETVIRDLIEVAAWSASERGQPLCPVLITPADSDFAVEWGLEDTNKQYSHALFARETADGWPSIVDSICRMHKPAARMVVAA